MRYRITIAAALLIGICGANAEPPPPPAPPPMPAVPDGAPSAEEYVKDALEALRGVKTVAYNGTYARWKDGEPVVTAEGDVLLQRADEPGLHTERYRIIGTVTEWPDGEPTPFEFWSDGSMVTYIDHRVRTVHRIPTLHGGIQFKSWNALGSGLLLTRYRVHHDGLLSIYDSIDVTPGDGEMRDGRTVMLEMKGNAHQSSRLLVFNEQAMPTEERYHGANQHGTNDIRQRITDLIVNPPIDDGHFVPTIPETYTRERYEWPPFDETLHTAMWNDRIAPEFVVRTQHDEEVSSTDLRGRVILAGSGLTWKSLSDLKEKFGDRIVVAHVRSGACDPPNIEELYREEARSFELWSNIPIFEKPFSEGGCGTFVLIGAHGELIAFSNPKPHWMLRLDFESFLDEYMVQLNVR